MGSALRFLAGAIRALSAMVGPPRPHVVTADAHWRPLPAVLSAYLLAPMWFCRLSAMLRWIELALNW